MHTTSRPPLNASAIPPISVGCKVRKHEHAALERMAATYGLSLSRMIFVILRAAIRGQPVPSPVVPYAPEEHAP